jgi:hypothetical protein
MPAYLIEILLPIENGKGQPVQQSLFEALVKDLTQKFGGATSFVRSPGEGLWRSGRQTQRDNIAVIQIMTDQLDPKFWRSLRLQLEKDLFQETIIIRAQEIILL